MVGLIDILSDSGTFDLLTNDNAAGVLKDLNGQSVLKNKVAGEFLKSGNGLLSNENFSSNAGIKIVSEVLSNEKFYKKPNFEAVEELIDHTDVRAPHVVKSILTNEKAIFYECKDAISCMMKAEMDLRSAQSIKENPLTVSDVYSKARDMAQNHGHDITWNTDLSSNLDSFAESGIDSMNLTKHNDDTGSDGD